MPVGAETPDERRTDEPPMARDEDAIACAKGAHVRQSMEIGTSLDPPSADLEEIVRTASGPLGRLSGSTVLVTGAAGFLGAYLCHAIARANDGPLRSGRVALRCLDNFATGVPERLASLGERDDVTLVHGKVEDLERLDADVVVHAASIASPPVYRRIPIETLRVNVLGTWRVLERAVAERPRAVLSLSSSEVYGDPEPAAIPTPETYVGRVSFTGPRACYDEGKRLGETLCRLYFEKHGVPVTVARPFNVYGPTLRLDDGRIVPDLLRQGLAGGPLVLHSDGTPTRSFCYVTDAIGAFLVLLDRGVRGEAYNVGNEHEVSIGEVARLVGRLFGTDRVEHRASPDPHYLTDNPDRRCPELSKIRGLGWRPLVDLESGLRRTVDHVRSGG